jgi:hypothetical protein
VSAFVESEALGFVRVRCELLRIRDSQRHCWPSWRGDDHDATISRAAIVYRLDRRRLGEQLGGGAHQHIPRQ